MRPNRSNAESFYNSCSAVLHFAAEPNLKKDLTSLVTKVLECQLWMSPEQAWQEKREKTKQASSKPLIHFGNSSRGLWGNLMQCTKAQNIYKISVVHQTFSMFPHFRIFLMKYAGYLYYATFSSSVWLNNSNYTTYSMFPIKHTVFFSSVTVVKIWYVW